VNNNNSDVTAVDLTNCDREQIHTPGAILPHGVLLALDADSLKILQVAGDTADLFGLEIDAILGRSLEDLLRPDQIARLRVLSGGHELKKPRHLLDPAMRVRPERPVDASIYHVENTLVMEFEDADPTDPHALDPLACVQEMLDGLDQSPTLQAFCQTAAERVRAVAGYDRVMVYRFQPDDSGWVFAESLAEKHEPFLDLHYPASDIPKQARALYLKSWLRLITQLDYQPARLVPPLDPRSGTPLDMSHATLRDVSPIHREYLRNMGVGASMSISIIVEGKLWGLIACHHYSPRKLPRHLRAICELFGAMFSLQLEARERADHFEARLASRKQLQAIMRSMASGDDYGASLIAQATELRNYIDAVGVALLTNGKGGVSIRVNDGIKSSGETPNTEQIAPLTDWLTTHMDDTAGVFATDRLAELWPPAAEFANVGSGLVALSISVEPRDFLLWFRPEVVKTVSWAGDPAKPVTTGPNGDRLTPRKSFDAWSEEVRGRSSPWRASDIEAAVDLRVSLLDIVLRRIDAAARARFQAYEQEQLLMGELDHRVKNTLANIQALVAQASRSAESLTDFTTGLEHRIQSMSKAHSLLTESRWTGASVADLVGQELDQYRGGGKIEIVGPNATLTSKAALALSLAVHELATNAAKYGSLSIAGGQVTVIWQTNEQNGLTLTWREAGGPTVSPPQRRGFGSTLIERALAIETGGQTSLRFDRTGVVCEVRLPADAVVSVETVSPFHLMDEKPALLPARPTSPGIRRRILVVEDSAIVLMSLEMLINDLGWEIVGPATRLPKALELAKSEPLDAALLDVNLDGEMSWPVADILKTRGIPFSFTTGYGAAMIPQQFSDVVAIGKPFMDDDIERQLRHMVSERS
jgi:two-component system, chemotaxis family, sensor kinase Cph1